jgi:ABC-type lipoprotein release transport system permease subunit
MTTIFYLSTIFFIWIEWNWLISPIEKTNDAKKLFGLSNEFKGKKWNEYSDEYKSELKSKFWLIGIILWMFIGLFTFQWVAFLAMLIFNVMIISPITKLTRYTMAYTVIHWINSLIGFVFGVFVIINHYHLKIDLTQWVLSFIK